MSTRARPQSLRPHLLLAYPALMLGILFLVPFGIMLTISFFHRIEGGFYEPAFDFANYERFVQAYFLRALLFSLFIAALAAAICVATGFPFTFLLSRFRRRTQVLWLVFLMSVLSLSEVIIGFGWSVLLSRTAGLSHLMVALGLMSEPQSWTPGFAAVLCGLCYIAFPYTVLVLYPPLSRLDPELTEAARTLGASPLRTFFTVVVPARRGAILAALILAFVFTLGSYLLPQILGRPQEWTLSVLITDQAIYNSNLPFAAALAVFLMIVSLALIALTLRLGRSGTAERPEPGGAR